MSLLISMLLQSIQYEASVPRISVLSSQNDYEKLYSNY